MHPNQISPEDPRLTLYALNEMAASEKAGFEKLLAEDPAAQQLVAEIREMAATVTAALEQEPADAAHQQTGKILRFPQAYFMISGLAAACFAVFFVFWQNQQQPKQLRELIEVPLPQAREASKPDQDIGAKGGVTTAEVATDAPIPVVTIALPEPSPMPQTLPLEDSMRGAAGVNRGDVASAPAQDRAFAFQAAEKKAAELGEAARAKSEKQAERQAALAALTQNQAPTAPPPAVQARDERLQLSPFSVAAGSGNPKPSRPAAASRLPAPTSASRQLVADQDAEAYAYRRDNGYLRVADQPLSTFSVDVDTASYANVRRFLNQHRRPPADAVRIEELVNYFPYDYAPPAGPVPFAAHLEVAGAPWAPTHRLVRIGLKGREISDAQRPAANLVFLVDVSGSMNQANKLPLLQQSLRLLVEKLRADDRVAIAVYAGRSGLVLPSTSGREKAKILEAIDDLRAGGSTNGALGIQLAYDIAKANMVTGGVNRVILATDGDFSVGMTSEGELVRLIEEKAQSGVFLTVLGFGMGNLKDSTLEQLADKGNGNYAYIDSLAEARKTLVEQAGGTLVTIAKDVKIQVEFNPAQVQAYRLIGYENRVLAKEDFNNDKVDAGDIGAGHTVTALYEVVPVGAEAPDQTPAVDGLKYQGVTASDAKAPALASNELLTVKVRYKEPTGSESTKLEFPLVDAGARFADASPDFKFAAAVAGFGMTLRDTPNKGQLTLRDVLEWGQAGLGQDVGGYRAEFLTLVNAADALLR